MNVEEVRVRFAPSPTGYLHVGGVRTAIFNWLYARGHKGKFLLRIEDTDVERSGTDMVQIILDGLRWIGLDWDEEPVYQSERLDLYSRHIDQLLPAGKAYKCFCTKEKLHLLRQQAQKNKVDYRYDKACLRLNPDEILGLEKRGTRAVVRLRVEPGTTSFDDQVYGNVGVNHDQLDDFIIRKSDDFPTYHFAVVIDDHALRISHVIRGEDHLSNTPKHILIYEALGWPPPHFAHLPLILGPDKQRLSKRHGATSIAEYRKLGYLQDAVFNFLTLLGWSPGDDRELFSRSELVDAFGLEGISKKSAVFDEKKLQWMNGQYLNSMSLETFTELAKPQLFESGILNGNEPAHQDYLLAVMRLVQPRARTLSSVAGLAGYFFKDPEFYDEKGVRKHWKDDKLVDKFARLLQELRNLPEFGMEALEKSMRDLADELNMSAAKLIHPTRIAVTGISASPGMFEVMELLGKETVVRRIEKAMQYLRDRSTAD